MFACSLCSRELYFLEVERPRRRNQIKRLTTNEAITPSRTNGLPTSSPMLGLRITGLMPNTPETGAVNPLILPPDLANSMSRQDSNTSHQASRTSRRDNNTSRQASSRSHRVSRKSRRGSSMEAVGNPPILGNNTSHRGSSRSHRGNSKSHRVSSTGVAGRPNLPRPSLLLLSLLPLQSSRGSSMGAVGHLPGTFPQPSHLNPLLNLDTPTSNLSLLNLTSSQFLNLLHSSSPSDKRLWSLCS